jgi:hypothetical protein
MRAATSMYAGAVASGARSVVEATVWLGNYRIATLPVIRGSWTVTDSEEQVPGSVQFQVPNTPQWRPTRPTDPLGWCGQRIHIRAGVQIGKRAEMLNLGWFIQNRPELNGDVIQVSGTGLLTMVDRAKLLTPLTVAAGTWRSAVVAQLTRGIIRLRVDMPNQQVRAWTCEQDRLQGLHDMVDAWPARLDVTDDGLAVIGPVWSATSGNPVVELVDGPSGTLSSAAQASSGGDGETPHNCYRVTAQPEGTDQAVSESWTLTYGPWRWGGPFGWAPGFYESAALPTNRQQLRAVAQSMTLRSLAPLNSWTVTASPDARVQKGDVAHVRDARHGLDIIGRVTSVTHTADKLEATVSWMRDVDA